MILSVTTNAPKIYIGIILLKIVKRDLMHKLV